MINFSSLMGNTSSPFFWAAWSLALVWQNYAFTRVSRARNSGSLKAHALASIQSNGVWFLQSLFVYSAFMNILTGKAGIVKAIGAALYYTVFTMAGSLYAHYVSLKKEKGASAVGANKKYAQITAEEWASIKGQIAELPRIKGLAEDAYGITVGMVPDARITAHKDASGKVSTSGGDPILAEVLANRG